MQENPIKMGIAWNKTATIAIAGTERCRTELRHCA